LGRPEFHLQNRGIDSLHIKCICLVSRKAELLNHYLGRVIDSSGLQDVVSFNLQVGEVLDLVGLDFNRTLLVQSLADVRAEMQAHLDAS